MFIFNNLFRLLLSRSNSNPSTLGNVTPSAGENSPSHGSGLSTQPPTDQLETIVKKLKDFIIEIEKKVGKVPELTALNNAIHQHPRSHSNTYLALNNALDAAAIKERGLRGLVLRLKGFCYAQELKKFRDRFDESQHEKAGLLAFIAKLTDYERSLQRWYRRILPGFLGGTTQKLRDEIKALKNCYITYITEQSDDAGTKTTEQDLLCALLTSEDEISSQKHSSKDLLQEIHNEQLRLSVKEGSYGAYIKRLNEKANPVRYRKDNNQLIVFCSSTNSYYAIDLETILGSGAHGAVYKAYKIDPITGTINTEFPYAAKKIMRNNFKEHEAQIHSKYYKSEAPLKIDNNVFLITEYIPGETLRFNGRVNDAIKKISFSKRCDIAFQISLWLNLFHHAGTQRGAPIIHGDIKGWNIHVDISTEPYNIFLFDFGHSRTASDDSNSLLDTDYRVGTRGSMAPEININKIGLKSDIYSLAPVLLHLFNAIPFKKYDFDLAPYFTSYDDEDLLDQVDGIPENPVINIRMVLKNFLSRTYTANYYTRPNSDELLQFFTALKNYCLVVAANPIDEDLQMINAAKLALLASGRWTDEKTTFENYDFSGNPSACKAITTLYNLGSLDKILIKAIALKSVNADTINTFISNFNTSTPTPIKEIQSLIKIIQLADRHKVDLTTALSEINHPSQSLLPCLSVILEAYKSKSNIAPSREHFSVWSLFRGYRPVDKISAANKFLQLLLHDLQPQFTKGEALAIKNGKLGEIWETYNLVISAQSFIEPTSQQYSIQTPQVALR